jgi:UDP-N-acetyl-D-glucosamine dehydrogenase
MTETSKSPLTGKLYEIPTPREGDREVIEEFLSRNDEKSVVVVQGLGFVGSVMSLVCANAISAEYAVVGVDLPNRESFWKIGSFREGILPISSTDPKVSEFFENARSQGNHLATFDNFVYSVADFVIVDVNLDVSKNSSKEGELINFDVDLGAFEKAIKTIADFCKPGVLIIVETTVPPGTCENVILPIMTKGFASRGFSKDAFKIGHSYERVMPGPNYIDSIQNFYRVYSGINQESADATEVFLRSIISTDNYPLTRLKNTNSTEMAKVLENSYRAMNIAFMVEWSRFAEEAKVDLYEVVNAIRMRDTHKNMMLPGIGVGGYCLTKDPLLASWSRQKIFNSNHSLSQSEQGVRINDQMPFFAYEFLLQKLNSLGRVMKGLKVLLLGVSYRGDVGDTRYSPVELFCKLLISAESKVYAHDYFVKYWEETSISVDNDIQSALDSDFDILVFTTLHSGYRSNRYLMETLERKSGLVVFDTIGLMTGDELEKIKCKHHLLILGNGD